MESKGKIFLVFTIIMSSFCVFASMSFAETADSFVYPVGIEDIRPRESHSRSNGYVISRGYQSNGHTGVDLANGSMEL